MALQADPAALRMAALYFSGASNAMEGTLNSMSQRILALVEDGQSGWIGDGATAFLTRFNTEVNHYRNGIHTLRQIPPILSYLAMEMDEIIDLRRRADELEVEAKGAPAPEAAWLLARAMALRAEAEAKAEFADMKGAAEFLAIDVRQMATDFWDSASMAFIRHEATQGVTWMKQEFKEVETELAYIGESVGQDPLGFAAGFLTSVGKTMSFGTLPLNEPDEPDEAYYAGRALSDIPGVVAGAIMTGVGGALEGGGAVLDITIAGAAIGVPAGAAGGALIAGGLSVGAANLANFSNDTNQMFARIHESGDGGSGENENLQSTIEGSEEVSTKATLQGIKATDVISKSSETVNKWWETSKGYDNPPYKPGTIVTQFTVQEDTRFVRVYDGINSRQQGGWLMRPEDIKGLTSEQIRDKYALPQVPSHITDVIIPKGSTLVG